MAGSTAVRCCVPFCERVRRTPLPEGETEWLCGEHWRKTSPVWRRRHALFKRRGRVDLENAMWHRLKAQAIERAAGLM